MKTLSPEWQTLCPPFHECIAVRQSAHGLVEVKETRQQPEVVLAVRREVFTLFCNDLKYTGLDDSPPTDSEIVWERCGEIVKIWLRADPAIKMESPIESFEQFQTGIREGHLAT